MLLLESDAERREQLAEALRSVGLSVLAVGRIAEIERWPVGQVVVTDSSRFTGWWSSLGATHVVVLADTPHDGIEACHRGASAWILRNCSADALVSVVRNLTVRGLEALR